MTLASASLSPTACLSQGAERGSETNTAVTKNDNDRFPELAADLVRLTGEIAGPWLEGDMLTMVADLNVADTAARRASRKAAQRLIPFLILCWVVNYLDRNNIGFAALYYEQ